MAVDLPDTEPPASETNAANDLPDDESMTSAQHAQFGHAHLTAAGENILHAAKHFAAASDTPSSEPESSSDDQEANRSVSAYSARARAAQAARNPPPGALNMIRGLQAGRGR